MLTKTQLEARQGKLTASRIAPLMTGDAEKIMRLYQEFIGEAVEEDLSRVWAVRLGEATEALQLAWYEEKNHVILTRRGLLVTHALHDWAACTLDAWDPVLGCPIECKHVGGHEPHEIIAARYQPQMHWQMWITGATRCLLSVIRGADAPIVDAIERDEDYTKEMVKRAQHFMMCVALREPPVEIAPAAPPPLVPPDKIINMTGNNMWAGAAGVFLETRNFAQDYDEAKTTLKSLMPEDAKICFGHGIRILRDRRGALHVKEDDR